MQLLESVWGFRSPGETRTVEVHVAQLRKKLGHPGPDSHRPGAGLQGGGVSLSRRVLAYVAAAAIACCALTVAVAVVLVRRRIAAQQLTALERQADAGLRSSAGAPGALRAGRPRLRVGSTDARGCSDRSARPGGAGRDPARRAMSEGTVDGRRPSTPLRRAVDRAGADGAHPRGLAGVRRVATVPVRAWSLAGLGGAALAALCSYLLARRLTCGRSASSPTATKRVAAGERRVEVPVEGERRAGRPGRAPSTHVGRARSRPRGPAQLPGVGQPRAQDAADLDPGYAEALGRVPCTRPRAAQ